jgi:4-amino-4-deoxy-L-arabinose transferase-like glycosyltransferase
MTTKPFSSKIRNAISDRKNLLSAGILVFILLVGAFLRFYHLGADGYGNTYYAATVKSMLTSWHNFFFAAFEPGGSVSVDKPPLGFWIEALSAFFLGVNGFALALPNAIAGVLSIFVVYKLVRRPFGTWAALASALVLAIMPVAISTERNNTIDGMLVFVLLLAAWAFMHAVYSGKLKWLLVGACIVGLGFNIKMLQAFLPLPAFYAVYFFGSKRKWGRKLLDLTLATALLLVVSLSWAVAVDLVPAADRPFVDSTSQNSEMSLIFEHNGIERLTIQGRNLRLGDGTYGIFDPGAGANNGSRIQPDGRSFPLADNNNETLPQPPSGLRFPQGPADGGGQVGPQDGGRNAGGRAGSMDFGNAGALRLFTEPLVGEASWLLPFVLGGLFLLGLALWKKPFDDKGMAVILWAGWLLPEALYFSFSTGLMHAYYLIMMGAPIAALTGMTIWAAWKLIRKHAVLGWSLFFLLVGATLIFQGYTLWGTTNLAIWAIIAALLMLGLGLCFFAISLLKERFAIVTVSLFLAALLIAPAVWSGLTTFNSSVNVGLPAAGPSRQSDAVPRTSPGDGIRANQALPQNAGDGGSVDQALLEYLLANTEPGSYLLATDRANDAAPYILATGRPVLAIGGFLGQYNEVSLDQLAALIKSGQLRFVLGQAAQGSQEINQWVTNNCTQVDYTAATSTHSLSSRGQERILYDCGG